MILVNRALFAQGAFVQWGTGWFQTTRQRGEREKEGNYAVRCLLLLLFLMLDLSSLLFLGINLEQVSVINTIYATGTAAQSTLLFKQLPLSPL